MYKNHVKISTICVAETLDESADSYYLIDETRLLKNLER